MPRPLIVPGYPENTTAVVGGQAKLVCKVHRPLSTKVQWLKTEANVPGTPPRLRALTVSTEDKFTRCDCSAHICPPHNENEIMELSSPRRLCRVTHQRLTRCICPTSVWRMQESTSAWPRTPTQDRRCRPCSRRGSKSCLVRRAYHCTSALCHLDV